ncbi:DUF3732 domain-containing protein [Nannocystis pusilla]|uniref:DUF3732 domain-containing protein n=1 Tax=Nannocystis pusilla TaxID=889268 RepID=UPI003B7F88C0
MNLQILALAIYNRTGERRELRFQPGKVNVVTGASKTGKTALIDIMDYCLGRNEYTIRSGVIRDTVVWYALHVLLPSSQAIIGRQAPVGNGTSTAVYLDVGGDLKLPDFGQLRANTNTTALEQFLTEAIGIRANEHVPELGKSSSTLRANIKHARFLLFQPQFRIADPNLMFYRQEEQFIPQHIKDTLPYFLGATGDDQYERLQRFRRLKRDLRILQRRQADEQSLQGRDDSRAVALIAEAQNVGLPVPALAGMEAEEFLPALRSLVDWTPARPDSMTGGSLGPLQDERERLLTAARSAQNEIDAAHSFAAVEDGFTAEATDQKNRLNAIELYRSEPDQPKCPLCEHDLNGAVPKADVIRTNLANLERQMRATTRQRPRLEAFLTERETRLADLRRQLTENKAAIEAVVAQEEALRRNRGRTTEQAKVVGRISLFLESYRPADTDNTLQTRIDDLTAQVDALEAELSDEQVEDRLTSILQVIGSDMSVWSRELKLEHSESPISFELRNLTVVAHRGTGPIRLPQMGSGENWMGYHIVTHLALQKLFIERQRPVPGLLIFDQPTQVYFPPEPSDDRSLDDLDDDDRAAVRRLFRLIFDVTEKLAPNLQVIITDHADLGEEWFQDAVVEKWRKGSSWCQRRGSGRGKDVTPASA